MGHQDKVRGGARALPLPRVRLDRRLAAAGRHARAPAAQQGGRLLGQEEGHLKNEDRRCFMWRVLAHCLGVEGLNKHQRSKAASCSGSFFYPELAGRRGCRPAGWQPALADAGVDFSGLPTDRSRRGLTLGATPTNTGGCMECPRCMARFTAKASWQRHRATQCYREIAERTRKAPLPGPEKSLLRYRNKASAELVPLTCYADLEVYSTPARRST